MGGRVSLNFIKFRWNRARVINGGETRVKLLGVIRVTQTFNLGHRSVRNVLEGRVNRSGNRFIQLEELPDTTRRVHFHSRYVVLLAD